jgi:allophanate hydrolase subunit 2
VNHRLSEQRIRSTCRELIAKHGGVSGRRLREELRQRFGAVGKTERVFAIWRGEVAAPAVAADYAELKARLAAAQAEAAENLARAQSAEFREQAHQVKWAMELDRLRMELQAARGR